MMNECCQFLPWDTAFWGYRIARVKYRHLTPESVRSVLTWCSKEKIDCLYLLATSNDTQTIQLAEETGFRVQDIRMSYIYKQFYGVREKQIGDHINLRYSRPEDLEPLLPIARTAYTGTRFYNDPCFAVEQCSDLYGIWLRRSLLEDYADQVIVAEIGGKVIGYVTCKLFSDSSCGKIDLVGVAKQARGQGIGEALINCALVWFMQQKAERVQVVTQGSNIAAQRLYQRCGFSIQSVQLWYHKWFVDCV